MLVLVVVGVCRCSVHIASNNNKFSTTKKRKKNLDRPETRLRLKPPYVRRQWCQCWCSTRQNASLLWSLRFGVQSVLARGGLDLVSAWS